RRGEREWPRACIRRFQVGRERNTVPRDPRSRVREYVSALSCRRGARSCYCLRDAGWAVLCALERSSTRSSFAGGARRGARTLFARFLYSGLRRRGLPGVGWVFVRSVGRSVRPLPPRGGSPVLDCLPLGVPDCVLWANTGGGVWGFFCPRPRRAPYRRRGV